MASFVVLHVSLGAETFATPLGTCERPFISVDSHVNSEILLLRKCLATGKMRTLEWLSSIVDMEMSIKPHLAGEDLLAASDRAEEESTIILILVNRGRLIDDLR